MKTQQPESSPEPRKRRKYTKEFKERANEDTPL